MSYILYSPRLIKDNRFLTMYWNYLHDTVTLLRVAVVQLATSMVDGNDDITNLTDSFVSLAKQSQELVALLAEAEDTHLHHRSKIIHEKIQAGVVAFQFYDKLSQRLEHVENSLEKLALIIADPAKRTNEESWRKLQVEIRSKYSMPIEHAIFQAITEGKDLTEALNLYKKAASSGKNDDGVELF